MKLNLHLIRTCISTAVALAAVGLTSSVASADTVNAIYNSATDVPVTANGYTATGNTVNFTLNFAPATGTDLMVVSNTGLAFINGTFDNLTNGQPLTLSYRGLAYNFVANYYAGDGNDLVLVWANTRPFAWGSNSDGQLGDNTTTNRSAPVAVATALGDSALYGKTVLAFAAGHYHSLAVCSDGSLVAWGYNYSGQLGDNTTTTRQVPVAVNTISGVSALYGKSVVATAAGFGHSLALCSDGTVAAWGDNRYGQLGENTTTTRHVPVPVTATNVLAGKTVVAIAAGQFHSLALCSDGTLAAWGYNLGGQLGDNTTTDRHVPVAVNTNSGLSALYGKTVVAIAGGELHSLAVCSDGSAVAWGVNSKGQLGDNTTSQRTVPVAVNTNSGVSALYGKRVVAVTAGYWHSLALCSDGTLTAWGYNYQGQLGDNTTSQRNAAVAVNTDPGVSALYGKRVVAVTAGYWHSSALCSEGTLAAWGYNPDGELGDDTTTQRNAPVAVDATPLAAGERWIRVTSGTVAYHTLALAAAPALSEINVSGGGVTIANGDTTPSSTDGRDFGSALVGSGTVSRTFMIQNTGPTLLNLTSAPLVAVSGPQAADFTVTLQPTSPLGSFTGSTTFEVTFAPGGVGTRMASLSITNDYAAETPYTFTVQGKGIGALDASYTTGSEVPVTSRGFMAMGSTVNFTLNFAPTAGTDLMVVNNTSLAFIDGTFDNLTNGQPVALKYGGTTYNFVANYYGGSGNDLVLVWASNRAFAWGLNNYGQLGDNTSGTNRLLPVPVSATGVLAGKTLLAVAGGNDHSLALCSDGTVAAWGLNNLGQLGDNTTTQRNAPVAVNTDSGVSALYGKTVVAIAAGTGHSLALCSDGTVAAWGYNADGELGDSTSGTNRLVPVAVNMLGGSTLYGKTVVAVAAGWQYSLALCSDGTVAGWGSDAFGALGDNGWSGGGSSVPVAVNTRIGVSALNGKTAVAIAAGLGHSLAACSDGTVVAWGYNEDGQLGDNARGTNRLVPVAVNAAPGTSALFGKEVLTVGAGSSQSQALCSDGTVVGWGNDFWSQLGDNTNGIDRLVPVAVNTDSGVSALHDKTVVAVSAGVDHCLALCSDGTVAAWGENGYGQLGDNTTTTRPAPVAVDTTALAASQRVTRISGGSHAFHTLALVAGPPASAIALSGAQTLTNGAFQFAFTNTPGAFFSVLATTNPALPFTNWTPLDGLAEVSPGQFQFTDPQATNSTQRYYRVRSP
jgi:alpha-tubulin suppressor-like RCC1 family protein